MLFSPAPAAQMHLRNLCVCASVMFDVKFWGCLNVRCERLSCAFCSLSLWPEECGSGLNLPHNKNISRSSTELQCSPKRLSVGPPQVFKIHLQPKRLSAGSPKCSKSVQGRTRAEPGPNQGRTRLELEDLDPELELNLQLDLDPELAPEPDLEPDPELDLELDLDPVLDLEYSYDIILFTHQNDESDSCSYRERSDSLN
uniref:Uncharacterized protein n=1 Tax=Periophthalmus magnuspinnatus TaxID=409849 RepID=A0A3B3ZLH6_9GOBI